MYTNGAGAGKYSNLVPIWAVLPPSPALPGAKVVKGLDQGALTLHDAPSVCAHTHLENQVDPAIPAVINGRAEGGARSLIVGGRRDEEDVVLSP